MATLIVRRGVRWLPRVSAYGLAWVASVTFFAGFYALLVPLPTYLGSVGMTDWQIGFVLGAFGIVALLGRPLSGFAVDRLGARAMMLVGAGSLALGALGVDATDVFGLLVLLRVLQAAGYVAFTTASTALVMSLVTPEQRASRLATLGAAANIAISIAPAAVALLLAFAPPEAGLLATAALACLAGGLAAALPASVGGMRRPFALFAPRAVWLPIWVTALLGAGFAAFFQFAPILAAGREVPVGWLYTVYGVTIIATRLVGARLLDRVHVAGIVVVSGSLMLVADATIAASTAFPTLVLGVGLVAVSGGLFHPALLAHHAALLPEAPGRASAAFYLAFDLGIGLGSWIFGIVLQFAGVTGLYLVAAALAAMAVPLATRLSRESRP